MSASADFDEMIASFFADDPLTAFYIQNGLTTFNPATGENIENDVEIPVQAIFQDLTLSTNGFSFKMGSEIQAGDKLIYVRPPEKVNPNASPLIIDPANDRIRIGTITYRVVNMKEDNPSATKPVLYAFVVRR